jgi:deoxycytidylate deaminase
LTKDNRIISTGYNGPASGLFDEYVPNTRPDKYNFMIHSEVNSILNANQDIAGCIAYVSGIPCFNFCVTMN